MLAGSPGLTDLIATLRSAERGLLVVAELTSPEDVMAALNISKALGWPVAADALSGVLLVLMCCMPAYCLLLG
jgi:2-succinyl-5-enolpyruvyl-6-hydroxy-3-cyclohexene-1-carboxylate synthase